jgi:hypothetical protein
MISAFEGLTSYYTKIDRPGEIDSLYKKQISEAKAFSSAPAERIVRSFCGDTAEITAVRNAAKLAGVQN